MRKLTILLLSLLITPAVFGQAQINTKKVKIADFTQKTTKVVLTGNMFYDSALQDEIATIWRISPYEFCSLEEFENLKSDGRYYFPSAYTSGKYGLTAHVAEPDFFGCSA